MNIDDDGSCFFCFEQPGTHLYGFTAEQWDKFGHLFSPLPRGSSFRMCDQCRSLPVETALRHIISHVNIERKNIANSN